MKFYTKYTNANGVTQIIETSADAHAEITFYGNTWVSTGETIQADNWDCAERKFRSSRWNKDGV